MQMRGVHSVTVQFKFREKKNAVCLAASDGI